MIISVKVYITPMMLGSRKLLLSQRIELMTRLIWKDMYVVWDKMKDVSDDFRESLKSYCKLIASDARMKLTTRYRLDTFIRINKDPKLPNLLHPQSKPRMQLRSMLRRSDPLTDFLAGYGAKLG